MGNVRPEIVPRLYFLLKAMEEAPPNIRIVKGDSVSFKFLVKWIRRNRKELYNTLLIVFGCESDVCLSNSMSKTFRFWVEQHIAFQEQPQKVGDVYEIAREWIPKLYPILPTR